MELFVDIFLPSLKPNQIPSQKKKTKIREKKTMQLGEIVPQILKKTPLSKFRLCTSHSPEYAPAVQVGCNLAN